MDKIKRKYYAQDVPEGAELADGEHAGAVVTRRDWTPGLSENVALHLDVGYPLKTHPSTPITALVPPDAPPSIAELGDGPLKP